MAWTRTTSRSTWSGYLGRREMQQPVAPCHHVAFNEVRVSMLDLSIIKPPENVGFFWLFLVHTSDMPQVTSMLGMMLMVDDQEGHPEVPTYPTCRSCSKLHVPLPPLPCRVCGSGVITSVLNGLSWADDYQVVHPNGSKWHNSIEMIWQSYQTSSMYNMCIYIYIYIYINYIYIY